MSDVLIHEVTKIYDGTEDVLAVDDFSLEIEDGEFLTVVGPSGSGKSTLLRMIAGLEDITEGDISIGGRRINNVPPQNRGVAMVFQNYALYPHMSVGKNMSYGLKLTTDLSNDEINRRVEEAAEMMGIENLLDNKPEQLSGGQQQRVATGRAIVREPEVFLMDEPLSNLDAKLRTHMRTELQRLQERLETTTFYVTHDQEEAMTMSDRIAVMNEGQLQQAGSPEEIYNEPANLFIADFIGSPSMNTFDTRLDGDTLISSSFEYQLSTDRTQRVHDYANDGDQLILGIRPEDIQLADERHANSNEALLDVIEPVGSDNYLYLRIDEKECRVRVPSSVQPSEDETVLIEFDEEDIHLFRQDDGVNILATPQQDPEVTAVTDSPAKSPGR